MSTIKVNEARHLSNSGTANIVLQSNGDTNLQTTSTLGLGVTGTLSVTGATTLTGNVQIGDATTDTVTLTSTVSGFNNFSGFTGEIRMYAGTSSTAPSGWLYCNGNTIGQSSGNHTGADLQNLFNLLSASALWGNSGSEAWASATVNLPDFRSRAPVGASTGALTTIESGTDSVALTARTLGTTSGKENHILTEAQLAEHTHVMTNPLSSTGVTANQDEHSHTSASHSHAQTVHSHTGPSHSHTSAAHTHTSAAHTHGDGSYSADTGGSHNHNDGSFNTILRVTGGATAQYIDSSGGTEPDLVTSSTLQSHNGHTHGVSGTSGSTTPGATGSTTPGATGTDGTGNTGDSAAVATGSTTPGATGVTDPDITITDPTHRHVSTAADTGSDTPHTILSPIIAVNYIIKI